jgi:Mn-containing catalase
VDPRSNIAAESRAKIVYERLINFTNDAGTIDSLQFLMTREITHMKVFTAALESLGKDRFSIGSIAPTAAWLISISTIQPAWATVASRTRADRGTKAEIGNWLKRRRSERSNPMKKEPASPAMARRLIQSAQSQAKAASPIERG